MHEILSVTTVIEKWGSMRGGGNIYKSLAYSRVSLWPRQRHSDYQRMTARTIHNGMITVYCFKFLNWLNISEEVLANENQLVCDQAEKREIVEKVEILMGGKVASDYSPSTLKPDPFEI